MAALQKATLQYDKAVIFGAGQVGLTRTVSRFMLTMVGLFVPMVREIKEMAYEFEEPYVVDDSRFRAAFGAQTTPMDEAVRTTVAWFRQQAAAQKQATPIAEVQAPGG